MSCKKTIALSPEDIMADALKYLEDFEYWLLSINHFPETLFEKGGRLYKEEAMNFAYACYRAGRVRGRDDG